VLVLETRPGEPSLIGEASETASPTPSILTAWLVVFLARGGHPLTDVVQLQPESG
jgi:hypothetical protein